MIAAFLAGLALSALGFVPLVHPNLVLSLVRFGGPLEQGVFAAALASAHLAFALAAGIIFLLPSQASGLAPLASPKDPKAVAAAVRTSVKAFAAAVALSVLLAPISMAVFPAIAAWVRPVAPLLIVGVVASYVAREKTVGAVVAGIAVFGLAGAVGMLSLGTGIAREPLLPLLTGLFGLPALLSVAKSECSEISEPAPAHVAAGTVAGALSGFLPAMTPAFLSAAAFLATGADASAFLAINAGVVGAKNFFDFANAFSIGKARSGPAAIALEGRDFAGAGGGTYAAIVLAASAAAAFIACGLLAAAAPKLAAKARAATSSRKAVAAIAALVVAGVLALDGTGGLAVLAAAAAVGLLGAALGARSAYASGALIVPSLAYQLGLATMLGMA